MRLIQLTLLLLMLMMVLVLMNVMSLMLRVRLMRAWTLRRRSVICVWIHGSGVIVAMRTISTEVVVIVCLGRCVARRLRDWSSHMMLLEELREVLLTVDWYVVRVLRLSTRHAWRHMETRRKSRRITVRHVRRLR